jgi:hypothetical protein
MTRPTPTIATTYARHLAAFIRHVPFGHLLASDRACLLKATARDARCSVADVLKEVGHG